ncbi:hypothetical protein D3C78_1296820 [compost metagenome]
MVTVCSALSPPASSKAMATRPIMPAQKIRCQTGVWSVPPEARVSTTIAPESAEVTKNTTTMAIAINDKILENGKCSRKLNSASATSFCTVLARSRAPSAMIRLMALLPNTVIHSSVKPAGTNSTPVTNSRMVRPRETRAINMPTKGDQDNHQPQYNSVHPPSQLLDFGS